MGYFDGAETCELVGCYLLSLLTEKYGQGIGLYRDDGVAAFNKTPKEIEKIKKELCKINTLTSLAPIFSTSLSSFLETKFFLSDETSLCDLLDVFLFS